MIPASDVRNNIILISNCIFHDVYNLITLQALTILFTMFNISKHTPYILIQLAHLITIIIYRIELLVRKKIKKTSRVENFFLFLNRVHNPNCILKASLLSSSCPCNVLNAVREMFSYRPERPSRAS